MLATGQCGFDIYLGVPGDQQYFGTTAFDRSQLSYEVVLYQFPHAELRHITLNFPLYQGVKEVSIGIVAGSRIEAPLPYRNNKKVIVS
jgi:hypothetical protein